MFFKDVALEFAEFKELNSPSVYITGRKEECSWE